jgi:hypothetical protein
MEEITTNIKNIDLYIKGNVEPNCLNVFENIDDDFIWYYNPARLIKVELQLRILKGDCFFSVNINDTSISLEDPYIKLSKNGPEILSEIDNTKNSIKFGDNISIRSYECKPNLDLLVKFLFAFE